MQSDWFAPESTTFGDRLAGAREAAGLSQPDLARRLGVRLKTLREWEEDHSEPRANRLSMLSGVLGVSLPWLIAGEGRGPDGSAPGLADILDDIARMRSEALAQAERLERLELRLREALSEPAE